MTAHEHASKVVKHLDVSHGLIYLAGTPSITSEDSDQPIPFKQRRYFFYLSGAGFEDCSLIYDIETEKLTLFIPRPVPSKVIWMGPTPSAERCKAKYDVDEVKYNDEIKDYVNSWREAHPFRHQVGKAMSKIYALHKDGDHVPPGLGPNDKDLDTEALINAMDNARTIKSKYEISLIMKANDISSAAHRKVLERLHEATNETHIDSIFQSTCVWAGAKKQAYGVIAAAGSNASVLHYIKNDDDLAGREMVCLDAGCEWENYASDVTRTFPISGTFSKEAAAIYSIVEEMQSRCIEAVKPGNKFWDIQQLAVDVASDGLRKLGILINGTEDEHKNMTKVFFPHGLGHHIGLECHDVSPTKSLISILSHNQLCHKPSNQINSTITDDPNHHPVLEPGMVITVEPGIYFNSYALDPLKECAEKAKFINWEVLARYMKVGGVRIEDDLVVTERGYENLTTAPKGKAACEIIRKGRAEAARV